MEDHSSHLINSHPMGVAEEGAIPDTTARAETGRMGIPEGEMALLMEGSAIWWRGYYNQGDQGGGYGYGGHGDGCNQSPQNNGYDGCGCKGTYYAPKYHVQLDRAFHKL